MNLVGLRNDYPSSSSDEEAIGLDFIAPPPYVRRYHPMAFNRRLRARFQQIFDLDTDAVPTVLGAVPIPCPPPVVQVRPMHIFLPTDHAPRAAASVLKVGVVSDTPCRTQRDLELADGSYMPPLSCVRLLIYDHVHGHGAYRSVIATQIPRCTAVSGALSCPTTGLHWATTSGAGL